MSPDVTHQARRFARYHAAFVSGPARSSGDGYSLGQPHSYNICKNKLLEPSNSVIIHEEYTNKINA